MMLMKSYKLSLMAAVLCGLSLTFSACSDDDNENGTADSEEVGGQTTAGEGLSDADAVLSALLSQWCEFSGDDAYKGIAASSDTYAPTVGEVTDLSQQTVRTLVVGTEAEADRYAVSTLSALGINAQQPVGFAWNGTLGSVSYQRGSGNELGVITVNVRQIPMLTKLRLVAKEESNAPKPTKAYYHKGDIVKYTKSGKLKDHYFVCLNDHTVGQPGNWISFDLESGLGDVSTSDCNWTLTGKDYYYDKAQASSPLLLMWLENFVLSDNGYDDIMAKLNAAGVSAEKKNFIVPMNDEDRAKFIRNIIHKNEDVVLEAWKPFSEDDQTPQCIKAGWAKTNVKSKSSYDIDTYTPYGLLLSDIARWEMHFGSFDYWLPNLSLVRSDNTGRSQSDLLTARAKKLPSQLRDGYFNFSSYLGINVNSRVLNAEERGTYELFVTAVHWTHDAFSIPNDKKKYYGLIDFTKVRNTNRSSRFDWTVRNITSHELKIDDDGKQYKYFEDVYSKERSAAIVQDAEGFFVPGSVISDEKGTRWFCYAGWTENDDYKTIDHKARFVAFENFATERETVNGTQQVFVDGDLLPESQVPLVGNLLSIINGFAVNPSAKPLERSMLEAYNKVDGPLASSLFLSRDTTYYYPGQQEGSAAHILAANFVYMPTGGRPVGQQPYMRYIVDQTRVGSRRNDHVDEAYPYWQLYTRYTGSQQLLDLLHVLKLSDYIPQNGPVKSDKWSRCVRTLTKQRDGDFTADNRFANAQNNYNFNDFKALSVQQPGFTSAYHEPVIVARYLELDDPGNAFQGTYNGHTYQLVSQPNDNFCFWTRYGELANSIMWMYTGGTRVYKDGKLIVVPYATPLRNN